MNYNKFNSVLGFLSFPKVASENDRGDARCVMSFIGRRRSRENGGANAQMATLINAAIISLHIHQLKLFIGDFLGFLPPILPFFLVQGD